MKRFSMIYAYFGGPQANDHSYFLMSNLIRNNKKVLYFEKICRKILGVLMAKEQILSNNDIRKAYLYHIITLFCNFN